MFFILVIDDHPIVRQGVISLLQHDTKKIIKCDEAATAKEARSKLAACQYDMLLLDISLPDESGLQLLAHLRQAMPELPILLLSMHPEEEYAIHALRLGARGYLTKESAPTELTKAVSAILDGGRYVSSSLAIRLAEHISHGTSRALPHETLSTRENQVFRLLAKGMPQKQIAYDLGISEKTVSTFRSRIIRKLGVRTTFDIFGYCASHNLLK